MNEIVIVQASPHANGVTDLLAQTFAEGVASEGGVSHLLSLREHSIRPCTGCGHCAQNPSHCPLAAEDDAEHILSALMQASLVVFCAPIYFYALPAQSKALIDRSQRFWELSQHKKTEKKQPAIVLLAAGRIRGALLFTGAMLTLRYFFDAIGRTIVDSRTMRVLEHKANLLGRPDFLRDIYALGQDRAKSLQNT